MCQNPEPLVVGVDISGTKILFDSTNREQKDDDTDFDVNLIGIERFIEQMSIPCSHE